MLITSPFTFHYRAQKIHHLYSLIITDDDFDSVAPRSMQDASHTSTQHEMTLLSMSSCSSEDRAVVRCSEVQGSIPAGNSDCLFVPHSYHVDQFTFHISLPS